MPDPFLDRIREAVVVPIGDQLTLLQEATKSAAGSLGSGEALDMVRVGHGREISEEADAKLRNRFNGKGVVVAERGETQMLATLSAITLIRVFGRPQYLPGLLPALATRAARNCGWQPVHPDLWTHADAYIRGRGRTVREPVKDPEYRQVPKEGEAREPLAEIDALREAVQKDRNLRDESDRILWWLVSRNVPPSAIDAALEFANLLWVMPEPTTTKELLRTKLSPGTASSDSWGYKLPAVPGELADFCGDLRRGRENPTSLELDRVLALLNEILLVRALEQRPIEQ